MVFPDVKVPKTPFQDGSALPLFTTDLTQIAEKPELVGNYDLP